MISLLEGQLKAKVAKVFKGRLTRGTLRRETPGGRDDFGDATSPTVTTFTFEGIRESFSLFSKANSGISDTDVAILVLLGSVKPVTQVKKDDKIYLKAPWNTWHQVRRILEIDPAGATVRVQAYEIPAPE